jgi:hypothetical protein
MRCNSSFTPGLLNPAFKPLGCFITGFSPCALFVVDAGLLGVNGLFWLIGTSAF